MRKPSFLALLQAKRSANRKPGSPMPFDDIPEPCFDVRMPARDLAVIITHDDAADAWCRSQCKSAWGRAIYRGHARDRQVPVYRFVDQIEAFWFKMRFG